MKVVQGEYAIEVMCRGKDCDAGVGRTDMLDGEKLRAAATKLFEQWNHRVGAP